MTVEPFEVLCTDCRCFYVLKLPLERAYDALLARGWAEWVNYADRGLVCPPCATLLFEGDPFLEVEL